MTPITITDHLPSNISPDLPIRSVAEDRLNRKRFSVALASTIAAWRNKPGLVIGLFGDWGSGKSSIKNMVVESLDGNPLRPTVVEFSPWQVSGQELLTSIFFGEIGRALNKSTGQRPDVKLKRAARWKRYSSILSMVATVGKNVKNALSSAHSDTAITAVALSSALDGASAVVRSGLEGLDAEDNLEELSLSELKAQLDEDLRDLANPLLVILDDIDRLTTSEIRLIFQLIKANANFPNVIYLLLAQRDIVTAALNEFSSGQGEQFLEKIVQVSFDVPQLDRKQIELILTNSLDALLRDASLFPAFEKQRWTLIAPDFLCLFRTLRDVNRFLASFAFHLNLFRNDGSFEVNPVDLITIEAIRVFEPNVYRRLAEEKAALTNEPRWFREKTKEAEEKRVQAAIALATDKHLESIEALVHQLFPRFSSGRATENAYFAKSRACSYQVFDRYFQFATPEGDISRAELDQMISVMGDHNALTDFFDGVVSRDLLEVLLARLGSLKEELPTKDAVVFLSTLYEIKLPEKIYAFLQPSPERSIVNITYGYLRRLGETERKHILQSTIVGTKGLGLVVRTIGILLEESRKGSDGILTLQQDRDELKQYCLDKIHGGRDLNQITPLDMRLMLRFWFAWELEPARKWLLSYTNTDDGIFHFIKTMLGTAEGNEGMQHFVDLSAIDSFLGSGVFRDKFEVHRTALNDIEPELVELVDNALRQLEKQTGPA